MAVFSLKHLHVILWVLAWNAVDGFETQSYTISPGQRALIPNGIVRVWDVKSLRQCAQTCLQHNTGECTGANYGVTRSICDIVVNNDNATVTLDQNWTFLRVAAETSCTGWKTKRNKTATGNYVIDPDGIGGVDPFTVYCDMAETPPVARVQHTLSNVRVHVIGYEWNYNHTTYFAGIEVSQLRALTEASTRCKQYIKRECKGSLTRGHNFVTSRDGEILTYFAGNGTVVTNGCACALDNSCSGGEVCNCNMNDDTWRSDEGYLTNKDVLPIAQVTVGDTGNSGEEAYITVGDLECVG